MSITQLRVRAESTPPVTRLTSDALLAKKRAAIPITALTAYDYPTARLVDQAGIDIVLVGDSLGMAVLGYENTLPVTLEEMLHHTRAVARGLRRSFLLADMPFGSYHSSAREATQNALRFIKEAGAQAVKIEGGSQRAALVHRLTEAEIPVVGHIGLTPQSVHALGGFKVQGRGDEASDRLLRDALAIEAAGAFSIVLEAVPPDVADRVSRALTIPTIGIGAGVNCDGQVLVCTDLLGMGRGHSPKFAKRFAELADDIVGAVQTYVSEVRSGAFPAAEHSYKANGPRAATPSTPAPPISAIHATFDEPPSIDVDMWH
jgi:3-methyl-2-oxobutanoate hydroxymethyltransferase